MCIRSYSHPVVCPRRNALHASTKADGGAGENIDITTDDLMSHYEMLQL